MALVSMPEAARRLGYHPTAVRRALQSQGIPLTQRGGRWYVDEADLARARYLPPGHHARNGRRDREVVLPPHWDLGDPATWSRSVTVSAHLGYHKTGSAVRQLRELRIAATDLYPASDLTPGAASAAWWYDVLDALLSAEAAIAEASPEHLARAAAELGVAPEPDGSYDLLALVRQEGDLEAQAAMARRIVKALR